MANVAGSRNQIRNSKNEIQNKFKIGNPNDQNSSHRTL